MPAQPNILWIVTTQWRASATGYAGDVNARTPCLDALAAESVNYTQAVTPHPFGPFARAALLTGEPSPKNGVEDYFDPLPMTARTIAHQLNDRGCATAFFGKWHLAKRDPAAPLVGEAHARMIVPPESRGGFKFWEGFESGFLLNDPWLHGTRLPAPMQVKGYQSDVLCERVSDWCRSGFIPDISGIKPDLRRTGNPVSPKPFFCVVSLEAPHPPYAAPAAGVKARAPGEIVLPANVPRGGEAEAKARQELAGYYAHIEATDRAIGELLSVVSKDTVVVFTSVHGDMHGAHGLFRKGWPHEESVRVPLLIRAPGVAARQDDAAVSLVDLAKMTRELAESGAENGLKRGGSGIQPSSRRGGTTARQVTRPAYAKISMPSVVALPHQCDRMWRGVRTKTRKLVLEVHPPAHATGSTRSPQAGSGQGLRPWLFFDLEHDPLEMTNLAGEPARAGEIEELRRLV